MQLRMPELIFDLTGYEHFALDALGHFFVHPCPCSCSAPLCFWNVDLEPYCVEGKTLHSLRQVIFTILEKLPLPWEVRKCDFYSYLTGEQRLKV